MGILIDLAIIGLFVLYIYKNRKTTQLRCLMETLCYVFSIIFSIPLSITLSNLSYKNFFRPAIAEKIDEQVVGSRITAGYNAVMQEMPTMVKNAAESYGVATAETRAEVDMLVNSTSNTAAKQITDIVARPVIEGVFRAVFFLILFVAFMFLLKAVAATFENLLYTPDRVVINTALCGVFGAFKAMVVLIFVITVIQFMLPAFWSKPLEMTEFFSTSFLFKLFYHNNVVTLFLGQGIYPMAM